MVWRMNTGRGLLVAISFLTRIPIRHRHEPSIGLAAPWFPAVGLLVGAIVGAAAWSVGSLTTPLVGAAVGVLLGVLVTGAFHEDGLADIADAFVGGWNVEDRLRILKDPLHGSYGVAALSGSIILRIIALGALEPRTMFFAAVTAHCMARTTALALMLTTKLARHDGLGADYVRNLPTRKSIFSIFVAVLVCGFILQWWIIGVLIASICSGAIIRWWSKRKIGGITGDVLGGAEQIAEAVIFVVLSAQ